ncbi:MAG: SpoIID/LytB domain-containing protein, partial [bacterium]|nr:SpoIID/LytB domain-containing protein [bacterium]
SNTINTGEPAIKIKILFMVIFLSLGTNSLCSQEKTALKDTLLEEGLSFQWQAKYKEAIGRYKRLLALDPANQDGLRLLGLCYYNSNKLPEALKYLALASHSNEQDYEIFFALGRAYLAAGDLNQAETNFRKSIELNGNFNLAYYCLAQTLEKKNDDKAALSYYLQAWKKDTNFAEIRLDLARLYEKSKHYNEAWEQYARINILSPTQPLAAAKKTALLSLLTKKPEEIIPPKRIAKATLIQPIASAVAIPKIRIGIGTAGKGLPVAKNSVELRCSAPFTVYSSIDNVVIGRGIKEQPYRITIRDSKIMIFSDPQEKVILESRDTIVIKPENTSYNSLIISQIEFAGGFSWGGKEDREYRGELEISVHESKGLNLVNVVNLEEYLYSVLPSEMISSWPMEALKAQAVIARGEAWYKKNYYQPHKASGYDVCDSQHCQVYSGVKSENKRAREAVESTRGELPVYRGKIAHTLYSSNCGGHTQSSSELKGWGDEPYLKRVPDSAQGRFPETNMELDNWLKHEPDVYCHLPKYCYPAEFRWARIFKREDLETRLNKDYACGKIKAIIPKIRSKSGHINALLIKGTKKDLLIEKEHLIRQAIGLGFLRSTLFLVEAKMGSSSLPESFTFYGGGWGHGVGMCQTGAAGMAEQGNDYQAILKHYYKGLEIEKKKY